MKKEFIKPVEATTTPDPDIIDEMHEGEGEDAVNQTALTTRPTITLATTETFQGSVAFPWLAIAHGVGKLSKAGYAPGDLVLGGSHLLYSPANPAKNTAETEPLKIIVLSYKQYWKEYKSPEQYKINPTPQVFATEAEAKKAGFTTVWDNVTKTPPSAPPAMTWALLIEKPKDLLCHLFCVTHGEHTYAPAYMAIDKGAYLSVKDTFGMAVNFTARVRGIHTVEWTLRTQVRKSKTTTNVSWVPVINLSRNLTEEEVVGIKKALAI